MNPLQKLVADRLQELGLGAVEAATQAGLERTYIRDIVEGRKKSVRTDKVDGLARALKLPAEAFSFNKKRKSPASRTVMVAAHVQAGQFVETWEWPDDDKYPVAVPFDAELEKFRLYAAETRGPSMNRKWAEGTVVVFTNVAETQESPIAGKRYIVERRRGGEVEHTVKLLTKGGDGKFWLMPESDDPRHQTPISVEEGDEEDEIVIVGRVWYAVTRE